MRVLTRLFQSIALAGSAVFLVAPAAAQERLTVVATTGMIADTARAIGGDLVNLRALMGPGVDPHAFRQTRSDIVALAQADLVLWNGLFLEAQMEDFLLDLGETGHVVAVAESLPQDRLLAHEDYAGRFDPHVWMDPALWADVTITIRDALIDAHPEGTATFTANTEAYLAELDQLGAYARDVLATVPEPARVLLSAHDAFGYFGTAYGFEVLGIQGLSTASEAGLSRISEMVNMLVARDIGAVFVETSVSDRNIRALIEGAAAQGHTVAIGGALFSDAMGEPGSYEGTYIGMIDHNVTTIARALGGTAPARGLNGMLAE